MTTTYEQKTQAELPLGLTTEDRVLVPDAHPDDEILKAALIRRLVDKGIEVVTITATDGEASSKGQEPGFKLGRRRRAEVRQSLGHLGVAEGNQHYLKLPDGRLHKSGHSQSLLHYIQAIALRHSVTAIVTAGADAHPDHRAVHLASAAAAHRLDKQGVEIAVWELDHSHAGEEIIPVDPALKQRLVAIHASQFSHAPGDADDLLQYGHILTTQETYNRVPLRPLQYGILEW